ncbi:heterokaryon incompatibility domain-containing protein [Trichoderma evansii]
MLDFIKSLGRKEERKWCGVCLFELNPTAHSLPSDVGERWEYAFAESDYLEFSSADLVNSSKRGCDRCTALISAFKTLGIETSGIARFKEAAWNPTVNSPGSPVLEITKADGTKQNLEICCSEASLNKPVLFADEPCLHAALCRGYKLPRSTGDNKSLSQAADWLAECRNAHDQCRAFDATFVPSRLLYLGTKQANSNTIELVDNLEHTVPYATLSHRWTEETPTKSLLTTNFLDRKQHGMPMASLPEMMQDAVSVLRRLGIEYVWIDCLCIVQDDKEDWKKEAALMALIYSYAELTVAASWCDKVGQRLFRDHSAPHESAVDVAKIDGQSLFIRSRKPHFNWLSTESDWFGYAMIENPNTEWPTLTRGWVYQEQLLSRRMLHFTRNELVWECLEATKCECGWFDNNNVLQHGAQECFKRAAGDKTWAEVMKEYAKRPLTVATDRLPALGGIAKTTAVGKGYDINEYLCGFWEKELESTFFWYLTEPPRGQRPNPQIPTWSWASADGNKDCWQVSLEGIEFLGSDVKYASGSNPFLGDVVSGTLSLAGQVVSGVMYHGQDWTRTLETLRDDTGSSRLLTGETSTEEYGLQIGGQFATFSPDYRLDLPGNDFISSGSQVFCLLFGRTTSSEEDPDSGEEGTETVRANLLVLRRTSEEPPRYERIGVNQCCIELESFLSQSERCQLTLV